MASTPLFKSLKTNGTSFYAFPGAAEDISAAYQNSNYKMYFSKYVLLDLPKQNLTSGSNPNPIYFNFGDSFERSYAATPPSNFKDSVIESLRNYVANHEVVLRESRLNNTKYYYDTNALETTTEKIFFKWCKKLNLIDFEAAIPEDEYFSQLGEFQSKNSNDDQYFPEFLWKEREVTSFEALEFYETANGDHLNKLEVLFAGTTNFRVGDIINFYGIQDTVILGWFAGGYTDEFGLNIKILSITPATATEGQKVVFDIIFQSTVPSGGVDGNAYGYCELVYHRLIQYVGEINGISNVQEANRSYTEVFAHVADHTGRTPDVLFRTKLDVNYKPNLSFPILPSQYQPEILGAELFNSPIVNTPQNYPGSYYGQFDTKDYTYETATGDDIRRSGDYYGINGDINNPIVDGSTIDGINLDFNMSHYVKMNIPRRIITNFDQFNAQSTNNEPPSDFEFNAILWYYTVEDGSGNSRTNLYGVSFLDNPDNNTNVGETSLRFPVYKKLVSNGQQDGTSYAFSLNLNFNIINDNTQETYNPEAINSMFGMNLFNDAMKRLASTNDSFMNIIAEQSFVRDEITNIKGLIYTQTDINTINSKILNLENLLRLYSSLQIQNSDTIVTNLVPGTPPTLKLDSISTQYYNILNILTSNMYNLSGSIPVLSSVPVNKNFLVQVTNNDEVLMDLPNNQKLTLVVDKDLSLRQSMEINIIPGQYSTQNKKMDIYMNSTYNGPVTQVLLLGDVDLPVSWNESYQTPNPSYLWKDFKFDIDFNQDFSMLVGNKISVPFSGNVNLLNNSIKEGDTFKLNNFFVGTSSIYDFSGQYVVDSLIGSTSSYVIFDVSKNPNMVSYGASQSFPLKLNSATYSILSNYPYFSLNKGKKIKITRISDSDVLSDRYYIEVSDIM
jgi:hypothetical protein